MLVNSLTTEQQRRVLMAGFTQPQQLTNEQWRAVQMTGTGDWGGTEAVEDMNIVVESVYPTNVHIVLTTLAPHRLAAWTALPSSARPKHNQRTT